MARQPAHAFRNVEPTAFTYPVIEEIEPESGVAQIDQVCSGIGKRDDACLMLDQWLDPTIFQRLPLPYTAGWLAAQAFLKYRRSGGAKSSPLPDFYIGAHAEVEGHTLVTRDAARYRSYFPNVTLIAPP